MYQGVLEHCEEPATQASQRSLVKAKCDDLLAGGCDSPYLLGFLVELLQHQLEEDTLPNKEEVVSNATELCNRLSKEADTVRCRYWNFISDTITRNHRTSA